MGYLPFTSSLCMGNLGVNPLLRDLLRSFKLGKHLGGNSFKSMYYPSLYVLYPH